jgi:hypothetical protein
MKKISSKKSCETVSLVFFLLLKFLCTSTITIILLDLEYNVFFYIVLRCNQCVVSVC